MKTSLVCAMIVSLAAVPAGAGLVTSEDFDPRAQCGTSAARMIVIDSEDGVVFPEDVNQCQDVESEAGGDAQNEASRFAPAGESTTSERSLDLATSAPIPTR